MTYSSYRIFTIVLVLLHHVDVFVDGRCVGRAGNCEPLLEPPTCRGLTGCRWNDRMSVCEGFPIQCEDIEDDCPFCNSHGECTWFVIGFSETNGTCREEDLPDAAENAQDDVPELQIIPGLNGTSGSSSSQFGGSSRPGGGGGGGGRSGAESLVTSGWGIVTTMTMLVMSFWLLLNKH